MLHLDYTCMCVSVCKCARDRFMIAKPFNSELKKSVVGHCVQCTSNVIYEINIITLWSYIAPIIDKCLYLYIKKVISLSLAIICEIDVLIP